MIKPIGLDCSKPGRKAVSNNISFKQNNRKNKKYSNAATLIAALGSLALLGAGMVKKPKNTAASVNAMQDKISANAQNYHFEETFPIINLLGLKLKQNGQEFSGKITKPSKAFLNSHKTLVSTNWDNGKLSSFEIRDKKTNSLLAKSTETKGVVLYKNGSKNYTIELDSITKHDSENFGYKKFFTNNHDFNYNSKLFELSDANGTISRHVDSKGAVNESLASKNYYFTNDSNVLIKNLSQENEDILMMGLPLDILQGSDGDNIQKAVKELEPLQKRLDFYNTESGNTQLKNDLTHFMSDIKEKILPDEQVESDGIIFAIYDKFKQIVKESIVA